MLEGLTLRNVLIVRNDRVGDLVLSLPAIEAVRRSWPQARITVLASRYAGGLLAGCGEVDEVLLDDEAQSGWQLARRLAARRFDAAFVLNTSTRNCLAVWAARIRRRVCWAYKPAGWLAATHTLRVHRSHPPIHESKFALAFVERLGGSLEGPWTVASFEVDATTRSRVRAQIQAELGGDGPLFGVHPGSKQSAYNWPVERYAELVVRLADRGRVMVTGSASEKSILSVVRGRLHGAHRRRVGFFTDWNLMELAAGLAEQTVLVVSSTGPMHLAGLVGTPTVALFSPHPAHAPAKWSPLGTNHTLLVAPLVEGEDARVPAEQGTGLMERIGLEQALAAALTYVPQAASAA